MSHLTSLGFNFHICKTIDWLSRPFYTLKFYDPMSRREKKKLSLISQVKKMRPRVAKSFAQGHTAMPLYFHRGLDFLLFCNKNRKVKVFHVSLYCFLKKMVLTFHVLPREQSNIYFCWLAENKTELFYVVVPFRFKFKPSYS